MMDEKQGPSQDDKVVAALGHAAAILPMWDVVVPVLIWVTQREKSDYIRQQSLQALAWQIFQIALFFGGMVLYMISIFLTVGTVFIFEDVSSSGAPPPGFFLPFCIFGFIFLSFLITLGVGLYAAVRSLQGQPYTYPLIGQRFRTYLAG